MTNGIRRLFRQEGPAEYRMRIGDGYALVVAYHAYDDDESGAWAWIVVGAGDDPQDQLDGMGGLLGYLPSDVDAALAEALRQLGQEALREEE